jgi:endonuclease/exonuclease/phosphatase family metal-dependent hydrolase
VRRRSALAWALAAPFALWALMRLFGLERGDLLVPLVAYTPFAALGALASCAVCASLREWAAAALAGVAAACLLAVVVPRALPGDSGPADGAPLRVLAANVHRGTADPVRLVALVRNLRVDLLSVEELTPEVNRALSRAGLRRLLPHAALSPREGAPGGGIYSRLPLRRLRADPTTAFRMPRAALRLGGRTVRFVSVHPFPPTHQHVDDWEHALESLPSAGKGPPWVLAGDFNATLDHAELREVIDRGYRDAADAKGDGLTFTWPVGRLFPPPVTIDHVLADERLGISDYSVEDLPGSDHRAVFAALLVPPRAGG